MSQTCEPRFKVERVRSAAHLAFIRQQRCAVPHCQHRNIQAHHLTCGPEPKARGLKASDVWVAPLCLPHHEALHRRGNEVAWWAGYKLDPIAICRRMWERSDALKGKADE